MRSFPCSHFTRLYAFAVHSALSSPMNYVMTSHAGDSLALVPLICCFSLYAIRLDGHHRPNTKPSLTPYPPPRIPSYSSLLRPLCFVNVDFDHEPIDGDGTAPETRMFAKFPRTPSDSTPGTPSPGTGQGPRRRIRCKMCR